MKRNEDNNRGSNIPESNSSKPMDSKRDVEKSNDEKINQDFPGYPHYPAKEDIMDQRTGSHRVDSDLENIGTGPNASGVNQRFLAGNNQDREQEMKQVSDEESGEGELNAMDSTNEEIGTPQNVSNEDLGNRTAGTDMDDQSGTNKA